MLVLLLLFSSLLVSASIPCVNQLGFVVTSVPGVQCAYCDLNGYISGSTCVCYVSGGDQFCRVVAPIAQNVVTNCTSGFCKDEDGFCVGSKVGVRCTECGSAGYIAPNPDTLSAQALICVCYSSDGDPNAECAQLVNRQSTIVFNQTKYDVHCLFFNSSSLGYYESNFECQSPVIGPVPNQVLTSDVECLTFGGIDPNQPYSGFFTCNNHGEWNATAFNCSCDAHWTFEPSGFMWHDEEVYSCTKCAPFYGPFDAPDMCSVIYTPDPLDGIYKPCSGHGVFIGDSCSCYFNSTGGYWDLLTIAPGIETCATCFPGYFMPNCTEAVPSQSPTASPTFSPQHLLYSIAAVPNLLTLTELGNRSTTNQECLDNMPGCTKAIMLFCYPNDDILDWGTNYSISMSHVIYIHDTVFTVDNLTVVYNDFDSINCLANATLTVGNGPTCDDILIECIAVYDPVICLCYG